MSAKRSRAMRAGLEALDRREVPSALAPGVAAHHVTPHAEVTELAKSKTKVTAATATTVSLDSKGTAYVAASMGIQGGQAVTTELSGRNKGLGNYTAELQIFYGLGGKPVGTGTGTLTAENGDQFDLRVSSKIRKDSLAGGEYGKIHFKVTDGLGNFTSATGSGTIIARVNDLYAYHYHLTGSIREVG